MKSIQKVKFIVVGMVITAVIGTMINPSMADKIQKQIAVSTGVSIYMDDVKLNPIDSNGKAVEAFIYNGTTYLPVRAVADAVGKAVSWDGKTSSVYLGKHDSSEPAVMLHELDYFTKKYSGFNSGFNERTDVKDNLGNSYDFGLHGINEWETYYINGNYSKMKGRYILSYDSRSKKEEHRLKIYGDNKLLYNAIMTPGELPVDFEIDLIGVLELKIELVNHGGLIVNTGLYQ